MTCYYIYGFILLIQCVDDMKDSLAMQIIEKLDICCISCQLSSNLEAQYEIIFDLIQGRSK